METYLTMQPNLFPHDPSRIVTHEEGIARLASIRETVAASPLCQRGNRYYLRHDDRRVKGAWRCVNCGSPVPEIVLP